MEGLLNCSACGNNFDLDWRRPKLLPCGHTLCNGCVWESQWKGNKCPFDKQLFYAGSELLQDDLQLLCWLEATAQGVLECICCRQPFDRLLRRPAALGCGHAVCRVCLVETNEAKALASPSPLRALRRRRDSVDESWDYSQEDGEGDSGSSLSSLPSDPVAEEALIVDCPVDGCRSGVDAKDHLHLVGILDGSSSKQGRVNRTGLGRDSEVLSKLERLESDVAQKLTLLQRTDLGPDQAGLDALLKALRSIIEHKDSPRSEQPGVFKKLRALPSLPDLCINGGPGSRQPTVDVFAVTSLKECMVELDVWDLALCSPGEMRVKKEALLHSDKRVWNLTGVDCWCDPDWTLRLLRRVAPDVEQLQLRYPGREHLQVVRDCMPRLRRLEVRGWAGLDLLQEPFSFDESPTLNRDTLEWLEVFLPTPTAMSLMRAHLSSLRKVRLMVADEWSAAEPAGDEGELRDAVLAEEDEDGFCVVGEDALRSHCWDDLMVAYGGEESPTGSPATPLASLSLLWPSSQPHDSWRCCRFAGALRAARPHLLVDCDVCRANEVGFDKL